jgi:subtilisin-like proprotein convertase family protein
MGARASWAFGTLAVACAGCLSAPPSSQPGDPDDADAGSTLTLTSSPDLPISEDEAPAVDMIEVAPPCLVADVTVDVEIQHEYRGDLDLMLLAPDGTPVQLTVADLDDDAENLIGNFPRDFTPLESLDLLDGLEARGEWTFVARDEEPGDDGWLSRWGLNLTCGEGRLQAAW